MKQVLPGPKALKLFDELLTLHCFARSVSLKLMYSAYYVRLDICAWDYFYFTFIFSIKFPYLWHFYIFFFWVKNPILQRNVTHSTGPWFGSHSCNASLRCLYWLLKCKRLLTIVLKSLCFTLWLHMSGILVTSIGITWNCVPHLFYSHMIKCPTLFY